MELSEIVLYHGSLEELNSRSKHKYIFASELNFSYTDVAGKGRVIPNEAISLVKRKLKDKGYAGLVNMRTSFFMNELNQMQIFTEGSPIFHVRS